ncbi:MAG TPA: polyprenol monophosphomannose synthase [Armatimonadetes bacterium]|jgi:dolichol-phosphate mannosyltransferase|nr:polyprenol monophosphomannose synthase [Armatimonadota bacterium]
MRAVVITPTYNERENLQRLVPAVLNTAPVDHLIVDDSSPDGTGQLADELARASRGRVHVLHRPGKQGLGTAYIEGFRWGLERGYELILEMDCDFSHDPADLPRFIAAASDADVVLGSRWIAGGAAPDWPWQRRWLSRGGSFYARRLLNVPYRDLTSGYKCFRRRALERIDLGSVQANGYGFQIEMTWRCHQAGMRVREIPIVFRDRTLGESKMSSQIVWEAMGMVWRLRQSKAV